MRPGWNATRRNRNIGTSRQGHGQNNRDAIPAGFPEDRVFFEHLVNAVPIERRIRGRALTFLVEPTRDDCVHACTVDDICRILKFVPNDHLEGLGLILLRQPTRKQARLNSVWGRFIYYADTGRYTGTAICLEAQNISERWRWKTTSTTPDDQKELERLRQDGHRVTLGKRHFEIERSLETVRATQLYRTLLHEIGHYVDWLLNCLLPLLATDDPAEEDRITREFDGKPSQEREAFAHRYADQMKLDLTRRQIIPFARLVDTAGFERDGLDPRWFTDDTIQT